jgi:acyl carrier protein
MTREEIRQAFLIELRAIAPEADVASIPPGADIRERLDLDSFSMLTLMVGLSKRLGVEVAERDYRKLTTVDGAVAYLQSRLPAAA